METVLHEAFQFLSQRIASRNKKFSKCWLLFDEVWVGRAMKPGD